MKLINFPSRSARLVAAPRCSLDLPVQVNALLDHEGFFTQSDEDFLADIGIASNDPRMGEPPRLYPSRPA